MQRERGRGWQEDGASQKGQEEGRKVAAHHRQNSNGLWPKEHSLTGSIEHHEEWLLFFLQEASEVLRHKEKTPGGHTQPGSPGASGHFASEPSDRRHGGERFRTHMRLSHSPTGAGRTLGCLSLDNSVIREEETWGLRGQMVLPRRSREQLLTFSSIYKIQRHQGAAFP